jgi:hypothetical protein
VLTRNDPTTMTTSAEFTRSSTRGGLQKQRLVKAAAKATAATACGAPAASPTILPAFAMSATRHSAAITHWFHICATSPVYLC